jgi:hypothetical protein
VHFPVLKVPQEDAEGIEPMWGIRTMAIDLSTLTFTNLADIVPASGTAQIVNTGTVNTLGGNDSISGTDTTGTGPSYSGINNSGSIWGGDGNDSISGTGPAGIVNYRRISGGDGDDSISGTGMGYYVHGISNGGSIWGGDGNDSFSGTGIGADGFYGGGGIGIVNYGGIISGGSGSDSITGAGTIVGIEGGKIEGGLGNDFFKARRINGAGNPLAITQQGGAVQGVLLIGGDGNDTFNVGWGNATINGGCGCDTLILLGTSSDYTITGTNLNRTITRDGLVMSVLNVENIAYTTVV